MQAAPAGSGHLRIFLGMCAGVGKTYAMLQAARQQRQDGTVEALVSRFVEPPQFGVLGEPRVNILLLNLALDDYTPVAR